LKALEAENRRLTEDLNKLKKDYTELHKIHTDHITRSMDLETRAATLNFQVHVLSRDRQTLEMHESALVSENKQLHILLQRARQEIESLKAQLGQSGPSEAGEASPR
jgi:TolA-binding protein